MVSCVVFYLLHLRQINIRWWRFSTYVGSHCHLDQTIPIWNHYLLLYYWDVPFGIHLWELLRHAIIVKPYFHKVDLPLEVCEVTCNQEVWSGLFLWAEKEVMIILYEIESTLQEWADSLENVILAIETLFIDLNTLYSSWTPSRRGPWIFITVNLRAIPIYLTITLGQTKLQMVGIQASGS